MSISDVLNIATSGLSVAQAQVSATSDNIANVNTVGYARKGRHPVGDGGRRPRPRRAHRLHPERL
ncbi:MAG: flagellar basal body protein [Caulobacteraceae bacterium]